MSRENVEVVRESWKAWFRGDMDGVLAQYDSEVVWDLTHFREWPDPTYRGVEGVQQFLAEWLEIWNDYEAGIDDIVAAPDGRVVVLGWQRGIGRRSSLAMDMKWAQINTVRNGRITRLDNYDDRAEALEAVGMRE